MSKKKKKDINTYELALSTLLLQQRADQKQCNTYTSAVVEHIYGLQENGNMWFIWGKRNAKMFLKGVFGCHQSILCHLLLVFNAFMLSNFVLLSNWASQLRVQTGNTVYLRMFQLYTTVTANSGLLYSCQYMLKYAMKYLCKILRGAHPKFCFSLGTQIFHGLF